MSIILFIIYYYYELSFSQFSSTNCSSSVNPKRVVVEMAAEMETTPLTILRELSDWEIQKRWLFCRHHLQASVPCGREELQKPESSLLKMKELGWCVNAQVSLTFQILPTQNIVKLPYIINHFLVKPVFISPKFWVTRFRKFIFSKSEILGSFKIVSPIFL